MIQICRCFKINPTSLFFNLFGLIFSYHKLKAMKKSDQTA